METSYVNGIDAIADERGVHFVWANECDMDEEGDDLNYHTFYKLLHLEYNTWSNFQWITDWPGEIGGFPSIFTCKDRIIQSHELQVSFSESFGTSPISNTDGDGKSQKGINFTESYRLLIDDPYPFDRIKCSRTKFAAAYDYSYLFFYKTHWHMGGNWSYDLYCSYHWIDAGSQPWYANSQSVLLKENANVADGFIDIARTQNDLIHVVYDGQYYRNLINTVWTNQFDFANPDGFTQCISGNGNDIYVIWSDDNSTYLRQLNYSPLKPQNLSVYSSPGQGYQLFYARLNWDANIELDILGYQIYRKITEGGELYQNWTYLDFTSNTTYQDESMPHLPEGEYNLHYKIRAKDTDNLFSVFSDEAIIYGITIMPNKGVLTTNATIVPNEFELLPNFPNPFNPETKITFGLPTDDHVVLNIYSLTGQKINTLVDSDLEKGFHTVVWNGRDGNGAQVASGVYIYELLNGEKRLVNKMFLMK